MTRAAWALAAAAGMSLAAGVGCYSPPQYAPAYGYPSAPAYPSAPGGSYVVPGTMAPGSLGAPTTIPSGPGPTLAPPLNGGDAPPYNTFDGGAGSPAGPSVPDYGDPLPGDYQNDGGFGADPNAGAGQRPDDGFVPPTTTPGTPGDSPFMEGTAVPRRLGTEQASSPAQGPDYFAGLDHYRRSDRPAPLAGPALVDTGVRPAGFEQRPTAQDDFGFAPLSVPEAAQPQAASQDGFGYERSAYRWLRGVVDYDPASRSWHIIYGLSPDPADRYGGSLTLAEGGQFSDFQDRDVVHVEGRPDPGAGRDVLGKPLYRVTKAELIGKYE